MNVHLKPVIVIVFAMFFVALSHVMLSTAQEIPIPISLESAADVVELAQIQFDHRAPVRDMTLSPDGSQLAVIAGETVQLFEVMNLQATPRMLEINRFTPYAIAYSPDGLTLVIGGMERERYTQKLGVWDVTTGQLQFTMTGHSDVINAVGYSPDGARIVSASNDTTVRLWDAQTGESLAVLTGHSDRVMDIAFMPDGELASVANDGTLMLWDIASETGVPVVLSDHTLYQVLNAPNTNTWFAAGFSFERGRGLIFEVDAQTGMALVEYDMGIRAVTALAFSPDGSVLATGQIFEQIHLWDLAKTELLSSFSTDSGQTIRLIFNPDGTLLFSAEQFGEIVSIWGVANGGGLPDPEPLPPVSDPDSSINQPDSTSVISDSCVINVARMTVMYAEPSMALGGTTPPEPVSAGSIIELTGQFLADDGYTWYQTNNGKWIMGITLFLQENPPADCVALPNVIPEQ